MNRTVAAGSAAGLFVDYSAGVQPGTLITAADQNMRQEELCHLVESVGWALDSADSYQVLRSTIALRREIGAVFNLPYKATPITVAASRSTTNPAFPLYLPAIDVTDADHDVPSTQAPDLVTTLRAYAATVLGSASFTATVAGSVLTFASNATNNALLLAIQEDALVSRWFSTSQDPDYAGSGGNYGSPVRRCVNVAGTDYAITAVNTGSRTITVSGTPTSGSQTVIFYPFRIAGSTTSVRLHRLSGFVPVAAGDSDGVEIAGMRHMDAGQGHSMTGSPAKSTTNTGIGLTIVGNGQFLLMGASINGVTNVDVPLVPTADPTNGAPRIGKNTSPRSHARHTYYWVGRLLT